MIQLFALKAEEQIRNLKYLTNRQRTKSASLLERINRIDEQARALKKFEDLPIEACRKSLLGIEGTIARDYWQGIALGLPQEYAFEKRSRRPAQDGFNATLNYLYGMLYTIVEGGLFAVGLDPHIGIFHADEYNKPTLSFDLIEPFRPWVDRLLLEECFEGSLLDSYFARNQFGYFFNKKGKAYIIPLFNAYLRSTKRFQARDTSVKNHIYNLAAKLARRIRTFDEEISYFNEEE